MGAGGRNALFAEVLDNLAEPAVLADELERGLGAHAADRLEVVAPEEQAQVDELPRGLCQRSIPECERCAPATFSSRGPRGPFRG